MKSPRNRRNTNATDETNSANREVWFIADRKQADTLSQRQISDSQ